MLNKNYIGSKVKIINFNNWVGKKEYAYKENYIGKIGIIKSDWGSGNRFSLKYDDLNLQEIDNENGNLLFRRENLEFLSNEKEEIKEEKEGNKMSVNINKIEVGMKVKQIKELPGFDYIGTEFKVTEIKDSVVMCANRMMGLGISQAEFFNYFEVEVEKEKFEFITIEIKDGIKITRKGKLTLVELPDGSRGASKCLPTDTYDRQRGYDIAFLKADIRADEKVMKLKLQKLAELRKY